MNNVIIVGSGIFGSTVARVLADNGWKVEVVEVRNCIGGNCHTHYEDGIEVHDYGTHIFHTSNEDVWRFVNRFTEFNNYEHHVVAMHDGVPHFLPFNMFLICQFFGLKGKDATPEAVRKFIEGVKVKNDYPNNVEEQAMASIGRDLYEAFVKGYTTKQWNKDPKELPAYILKRIPVRYNFSINYFNDIHQGIPLNGYTKMIENMLNHENITVKLGEFYDKSRLEKDIANGRIVVYTGQVDELMGYGCGELEWRSLKFETKRLDMKDFQGNGTVNYVDADIPYTRIHEYKHYHPERLDVMDSDKTIIQYEYPDDWERGKEMFYPIDNAQNSESWMKYSAQVDYLYGGQLILGGRLGLYRYFDMDDAIAEALKVANQIVQSSLV